MNVFRWTDDEEWSVALRTLMEPLLDQKVIQTFLNKPPDSFFGDDLSWLERIIKKAHGRKCENFHNLLVNQLRSHYQAVVAFHGCRPVSVESYQIHGLLPASSEQLRKTATESFGTAASVLKAIDNLATTDGGCIQSYEEHNSGRCYLALSYDFLVNSCGHYMLYGSEYLLCVAKAIGKANLLRHRGKAVIIECLVPTNELPSYFFKELGGNMVERMFKRLLDDSSESEELNFGFPIKNKIPPENIIKFHYPTKIPNPHNRMLPED